MSFAVYLLLESVKRAYDRGEFNQTDFDLACPVELEEVELYLQILAPAYFVSIGFQYSHSSLCYVLVAIKELRSNWETMDADEHGKELCKILIECLVKKFDF